MAKFTKVAIYDNGDIKSFMTKGQRNPCGCGSNCYYYISNDTEILGVCNSCDIAIYQIKEEYIKKELTCKKWKELDRAVYY